MRCVTSALPRGALGIGQSTLSGGVRGAGGRRSARGSSSAARGGSSSPPEGRRLLGHAQAAVAAADAFEIAASSLGGLLCGPLRIGLIPTVAPYLLPALLARLGRTAPGLELHVREDQTETLLAALRGGDVDAAVLALPVAEEGIGELALYDEEFVVVVPAGHPWAGRADLAPEAVSSAGLLLLEPGHCLRDQTLALCGPGANGTPGGAGDEERAVSLPTIVQLVAGGLGITVLPASAQRVETRRTRVATARFAGEPPPGRRIGLAFRASAGREQEWVELAALDPHRRQARPPAGAGRGRLIAAPVGPDPLHTVLRSSRAARSARLVDAPTTGPRRREPSMATTDADSQLKARHRAMWAAGDYPSIVETFLTLLGPRLVEACGIGPGMTVLDVAAGTGNAAIPARARRRGGDRERPHAGAAGGRQTARRGGRRRAGLGRGRRRGAAVRRRVVRLRDLVDRRDVRAPPPADRRRAGARLPSGRHDRPAELDAGGDDRRPLPHDRPVRAPAAARRPAAAAVGQRRAPARAARRPGRARPRREACWRSTPSRSRATSPITSAPATARRSQPRPTPARDGRGDAFADAINGFAEEWNRAADGTPARFEMEYLLAVATRR